jgi:hypothetical protein
MTSFVHTVHSDHHAGAERAANVAENVSSFFSGSVRGAATMLLAAAVSAVVVIANQVLESWSDDHTLAAWAVLWAVAFAATALLAAPLRRLVSRSRNALRAYKAHSEAAAQDHQMWELALVDARVMAEISRSMKAGAPNKVAYY